MMTPEQIASITHEANRAYQAAVPMPGVPISDPWPDFVRRYPNQAAGVIAGVEAALKGATPEEMHTLWCQSKYREGWKYGELKNTVAKTHPALLPYLELPEEHKLKDRIFVSIVRAASSSPDAQPCPLCGGVHTGLPDAFTLAIGDGKSGGGEQ